MIKEFYTNRLYVRSMTVADSSSLYPIWSDPDVARFMNVHPFKNENEVKDMITYLNQLTEEYSAIRYSIIELNTQQIIGSCGYNSIDYVNAVTEIGYDLAKASWGRGYATEVASALIHYAFTSLQMNRVEAKVEPPNTNSIRVLQKLNFTYEGLLRQAQRSRGRFIDLNIYSRLRSDRGYMPIFR
ncbi:GNAT family N-acetyltransferase [Halobacillus massiliensis]|uniref:GNAT family N-acetyltransferase n=1 Tax=Halobacillus massiliensis TaxID=1926286 RepID=UPI0009E2CBFF|nr:GNAT family protein [Halobacillus massiliensis]